jgi:hypothetical protein
VPVRIRNGGAAIDAALSFTPMHTLSGIPPASVTASTTPASNNEAFDSAVQLSTGVDYRVLVRPVDTSLPPFRGELTAQKGADLSVEFSELETQMQVYSITAPADHTLIVRALDLETGEPISSTATVTAGMATLLFAGEPSGYRLEIRAEDNHQDASMTAPPSAGALCDADTPVYPVYSIADRDLTETDKSGAIKVILPEAPARIRYEGTVALCPEALKGAALKELPVSLHSTELLVPVGSGFSASFDAKTSAQYDDTTKELSFCVQLLEGSYDVVVTPPTSASCAIYAEHRLIEAPDKMAASGARFELHDPAYLRGTVRTKDLAPVAGATVDAIALGRATTLDLGPGDQPLTRYNRSRQVVTAADGTFSIPVDLGSYDLQVKGPASSGFSWQVQHDIDIGSRIPFKTDVDMSSPVMLTGRLGFANDGDKPQSALAGAEVLAFAVIRDKTITPSTGEFAETSERAVAIGKTMADSDGAFTLLLPQDIAPKY